MHPSGRTGRATRLTTKEEGFCVDVASGVIPRDAYQRHYNWTGTEKAMVVEVARMLAKPKIAARIAELRDAYAKAAVEKARGMPEPGSAPTYTVADAMVELDCAFSEAEKRGQTATMAKVVEVKMRLYGLGISDGKKNPADAQPMGYDELREALERIRAAKGAA